MYYRNNCSTNYLEDYSAAMGPALAPTTDMDCSFWEVWLEKLRVSKVSVAWTTHADLLLILLCLNSKQELAAGG